MDNTKIAGIRLLNHQLSGTDYTTPRQIVAHFGIMQAQDFNSVKWAIGVRLRECTEESIEESFNRGEILRTHVLRPTWHFITSENIRWMLQLSAKRILQSMKSRDRELGLTDEIYGKCYRIIEKTLEKEDCATREELTKILYDAGVKLDSSQIYHIIAGAEATGIICSGALREKKHTYALLGKRVPAIKPLTKEESLAKLARMYFMGHGPAALPDFVWWSGLSVGEARQGLESVRAELISETIDGQKYWMPDTGSRPLTGKSELYLLPAFDEYIVGYKDRTAVITSENHRKAISSNGVFRPVMIKDGKVIGLWKKATSGKRAIVIEPFEAIDRATQKLIDAACVPYHSK